MEHLNEPAFASRNRLPEESIELQPLQANIDELTSDNECIFPEEEIKTAAVAHFIRHNRHLHFFFLNICILIFNYIVNFFTDIYILAQYINYEDYWFATITGACLLLPYTVEGIVYLHERNPKLTFVTILLRYNFGIPLNGFLKLIILYLKLIRCGVSLQASDKDHKPRVVSELLNKRFHASYLHMKLVLLSFTPQLVLQLYILLISDASIHSYYIQILYPLISISWTVVQYVKFEQIQYDKMPVRWRTVAIQFLWYMPVIVSRVIVLALFATEYKFWLGHVLFGHCVIIGIWWFCLQVWKYEVLNKPKLYTDPTIEDICDFFAEIAMNTFCFLRRRKNFKSEMNYSLYYSLSLLVNLILMASWWWVCDFNRWQSKLFLSLVVGLTLVGKFFQPLYHVMFLYARWRSKREGDEAEPSDNVSLPKVEPFTDNRKYSIRYSILIYIADIASDISLAFAYYQDEQYLYSLFTSAMILLPLVAGSLASRYEESLKPSQETRNNLSLIDVLYWPINLHLRQLMFGLQQQTSFGDEAKNYADKVLEQKVAVSRMKIRESLLESAPQSVFQIYVMLIDPREFGARGTTVYKQLRSIISSFISLSWSVANIVKMERTQNQVKVPWGTSVVHFLWFLPIIVVRILALALYATEFKFSIWLALLVHWLIMIMWLLRVRRQDKPNWRFKSTLEEINFYIETAMNTFCFLKRDNNFNDEFTYHLYYSLSLLVNCFLVCNWWIWSDHSKWYYWPLFCTVVGFSLVAILFQPLYHTEFLPTSKTDALRKFLQVITDDYIKGTLGNFFGFFRFFKFISKLFSSIFDFGCILCSEFSFILQDYVWGFVKFLCNATCVPVYKFLKQQMKSEKKERSGFKFTKLTFTFTLLSICIYIVDIGCHYTLAAVYFWNCDYWSSGLTFGFLSLPILIQLLPIFYYYVNEQPSRNNRNTNWHKFRLRITTGLKIPFEIFHKPIEKNIEVLELGFELIKGDNPNQEFLSEYIQDEMEHAALWRSFEAMLESAPQLILQFTIVLLNDQTFSERGLLIYLQLISMVISLLSLTWTLYSHIRIEACERNVSYHDRSLVPSSTSIVQFLWYMPLTIAKILAISLFATEFHAFLPTWALIEWAIVSDWPYWLQRYYITEWSFDDLTKFIHYSAICIFCSHRWKKFEFELWFDLKLKIPMFSLNFVELIVLMTVWYWRCDPEKWYRCASLWIVPVFYLFGFCFMILYYCKFHPSVLEKEEAQKENSSVKLR